MKKQKPNIKNHSSLIVSGDVDDLESNAWWNMDDTENEYNTHHYERLKKLCLSDPVHTIVLKAYIESQVKKIELTSNAASIYKFENIFRCS